MGKAVENLQGEAAELVQYVASRQQIGKSRSQEIQAIVIQRAAKAIAEADLFGQNKLLRTLHALLHGDGQADAAHFAASSTDLLQLLRAGLSTEGNRPTLHQWADFIFSILPLARNAAVEFLVPLASCICDLLLQDLQKSDAVAHGAQRDLVKTEFTTLINLVERIVNLCFGESAHPGHSGENSEVAFPAPSEREGSSSVGTPTANNRSNERSRQLEPAGDPVAAMLDRLVFVLKETWRRSEMEKASDQKSQASDLSSKIHSRCRRAIERLYRLAPLDVFVALIASEEGMALPKIDTPATLFSILDFLVPSEQIVVTYACDIISSRFGNNLEKGKRKQSYPHL